MAGTPGMPAEPLMDLILQRALEAGTTRKGFLLARFGEAGERNWWRWVAGQTVRRDCADEICNRLGVHPGDVCPEWDTPRNGGPVHSMRDQPWRQHAACKGTHPDVFFPDSPHEVPIEAQALCLMCPVFDDCFTYGLTQLYGVWAATSEAERHRIRRQRGINLHLTFKDDHEEIA